MALERELPSLTAMAFLSQEYLSTAISIFISVWVHVRLHELLFTVDLFVFCPDKGRHKTDSLSFQTLFAPRAGTLQLISIGSPSVFN